MFIFSLTGFLVLFQEDDLKKGLPYDVNFKTLLYFMVAPTLCYQVIETLPLPSEMCLVKCCFLVNSLI